MRTTMASPSSGSMISSASRDLPAPASPMIDTTPLWPLRTSSTAAFISARSLARPTNGTSQRTGRVPAAAAPVTSHDCSSCSRPRIRVMPNGSRSMASEHRAAVAEPTSTPPGGANDCSREAVLTTSPIAV